LLFAAELNIVAIMQRCPGVPVSRQGAGVFSFWPYW
jgi:hypothetical protein